jgi:hypothetical protein
MKRGRAAKTSIKDSDELQPEYRFDYRKANPNRFAARYQAGSRVVVLEPDVAKVFKTQQSVNAVLRALLETMPAKTRSRPRTST